MLSFSEKHGPKHAKVQGKLCLAITGATTLTTLQKWKLMLVGNMLQCQRATLLPKRIPEQMNIPNLQAMWQQSTLLFCLQEQKCIEMAQKYSYLCRGNFRIWFHSNTDWNQDFYTKEKKPHMTVLSTNARNHFTVDLESFTENFCHLEWGKRRNDVKN